jgi:endonuclease YncB( thermonuclease family)
MAKTVTSRAMGDEDQGRRRQERGPVGRPYGNRRLFARRERAGMRGGVSGRRIIGLLATMAVAALGAWLGLVPQPPAAPPPVAEELPPIVAAPASLVRVVDGDTLRLGEATVRLSGLDAPERGQPCQRADGTRFDCGEAAARQLAAFVQRRGISCSVTERDRYGRLVGVCHAEGRDLAEAMVASGWAIAVADGRRGPARYGVAEAQARSSRHGLWDGRFETPETWRRSP